MNRDALEHHCPTCGAQVRVVAGREGTAHYQPTADWALYECAKAAGADVSGGPPTWPTIGAWALEAVQQLRRDYEEVLGDA